VKRPRTERVPAGIQRQGAQRRVRRRHGHPKRRGGDHVAPDFLGCGQLERGFAPVRCDACRFERLVAFSGKGRTVCPSCGGRRMAEQAAHLVDAVLSWVPVRQWVLTVPHRLRYRLAFDHALCRAVLGVLVRAVLGWYRRRGRRAAIVDGRSGTITVVQRFGSGLELNVHFHALGLDGVFAAAVDGALRFHRLPPPTDADIAQLVTAIARRIGRLLARRDLTVEDDGTDPLTAESLALAGLASAAVQGRLALGPRAGARVERLGHDPDAPWVESSRPLQARCDGCDLHAGIAVGGRIAVGWSSSVDTSCGRPSPRTASRCDRMARWWCCSRRRGGTARPTCASSRSRCSNAWPR